MNRTIKDIQKDIELLGIKGGYDIEQLLTPQDCRRLSYEIERLNNIIKEVREYINSIDEIEVRYLDKEALYRNHITEYQIQEQLKKDKTLEGHFVKANKYYLLEILEKENI